MCDWSETESVAGWAVGRAKSRESRSLFACSRLAVGLRSDGSLAVRLQSHVALLWAARHTRAAISSSFSAVGI